MVELAIVIPYYKMLFFERTIASLAEQTNKNFKVYIGNDGSPEDPSECIENFCDTLDITYKYFPDNLGGYSLTRQWDRCIELMGSENWILILGDDDYLSPNFVQNFYNHLAKIESLNIKVVRSASKIVSQDGISKIHSFPEIESSIDHFYNRYFKSSRSSLSEYIFSKDVYDKKGFRDLPLAWGVDTLAWIEFTEGKHIFTINESIAYIQISEQSISGNSDLDELKIMARYQGFEIVIKDHFSHYNRNQKRRILLYFEHGAKKANKVNESSFYLLVINKLLQERMFFETFRFMKRLFYYKRLI
ncbi:glycosyltransferase family 2 protein [Christiangramia sp. SM2212]|uniref:Glycosyltransferase family 2 protein n=1 Tax=Christiangramia sediminicola TaxID=3073267 RepID=A0ABU1EMS7_9FLAO|nr:glycosyltransferase family 2 protein [Christiangramia sp. SM2212]MDR5589695.1 glycosyltransferase family 2 protein [Christiangramia sp. SM2212]